MENSKFLYSTITQLSYVWKPVTGLIPLWSILRWRCMLRSNRDLSIHVIMSIITANSALTWIRQTISTLNILICLVLQNCIKDKVLTKALFQFIMWIVCWRAIPLLKSKNKMTGRGKLFQLSRYQTLCV